MARNDDHARDRACVRRKNEEDGRRTARPLVQGRRRSQLRAEAACRCVPLLRYKRAIWKRGATPIVRDAARVKRFGGEGIANGSSDDGLAIVQRWMVGRFFLDYATSNNTGMDMGGIDIIRFQSLIKFACT